MAELPIQVEIFGDEPVARLVYDELTVVTVSEIDLAMDAGCTVELRRTDTPGETFDDRPHSMRRRV